jgi:hypothetical protein
MNKVKSIPIGSMRRAVWLCVVISLLILGSVLPLWCEEPEPFNPYWKRLREQLREQNWQEQEIGALEREAHRFDWTHAQEADPRIIAYALQYAKSSDGDIAVPIRARLTYELSLRLSELSSSGYSVRTMTRMALAGTRDVIQKLSNQSPQVDANELDQDGGLGQMIRVTLRSRFQAYSRNEVQVQVRGSIGGQDSGQYQSPGAQKPDRGRHGGGNGKK